MCIYLSFIVDLVLKDPVFKRDDKFYLSTEEAFDTAMTKSVRFIELLKEEGITNPLDRHFVNWLRQLLELSQLFQFNLLLFPLQGY